MSELRNELITIQARVNSVKCDIDSCKDGKPMTNNEMDELNRRLSNADHELQDLIDEVEQQ